MPPSGLEQQYHRLSALAKATPTTQRPRQRRETLAMIEALAIRTAAGEDQVLHARVQQLLAAYRREIGLHQDRRPPE